MNMTMRQQTPSLAQSAFENYRKELHQFLARRLPSPQDANDVVQEVFLRLLRLNRADLVRNPQAYLYGIASHVVREFHARAKRDRVTFDSQAVERRTDNPHHLWPDQLAEGLGLSRQIAAALAELPAMQQRVLLAEMRDGLSHEQIARELGLNRDTVRQYSARAMAFIRSRWNQCDGQD
jgi:RNA polymerase sigma factor, sigma-70 family